MLIRGVLRGVPIPQYRTKKLPNTAIPHRKIAKYRKQLKNEKPRCSYSILLYCYVARRTLSQTAYIRLVYWIVFVMGSLLQAFK